MFAFVAANIPMNPANAELEAPTKTAVAVSQPKAKNTNTARTRTKTTRYIYSVFMKLIAPEWIMSPIFFTSGFPSG